MPAAGNITRYLAGPDTELISSLGEHRVTVAEGLPLRPQSC